MATKKLERFIQTLGIKHISEESPFFTAEIYDSVFLTAAGDSIQIYADGIPLNKHNIKEYYDKRFVKNKGTSTILMVK